MRQLTKTKLYCRYLVDNWLPHTSTFAGYTRVGKQHNNVHTNNHLERYVYIRKTMQSFVIMHDCVIE